MDILETPESEREVVFLGLTTDAKGKQYSLWTFPDVLERATDWDELRRACGWYPAKGHASHPIGGRYTLKCEREGDSIARVWFGTLKYVGQHPSPMVELAQATDRNAKEQAYNDKQERAAKSDPVFMRDMERTVERLKRLPKRQALRIADAIAAELRLQILNG